jgi:hypothetical protein
LKIDNVFTTYHVIKLLDCREFDKVNINALIEKWMSCDALWVPRRKEGEHCLRIRGKKKHYSNEYMRTMLIPTLLIPPLTKNQ